MPTPIILLHGALGTSQTLQSLAQELSGDFQVHQFNFNSHGGPSVEAFGMAAFSEQLKAYILSHSLERPAVFGYSMGGYAALNLARQEPELLGPIICLGTKLAWSVASAQQEVKMLQADKIEEKVPRFAQYLAQLHGESHWKTLLEQTAGMMLEMGAAAPLSIDNVSAILNRILLCRGAKDQMVSQEETEQFCQALPNATTTLLEETPHQIEKVNARLLAQTIQSFL